MRRAVALAIMARVANGKYDITGDFDAEQTQDFLAEVQHKAKVFGWTAKSLIPGFKSKHNKLATYAARGTSLNDQYKANANRLTPTTTETVDGRKVTRPNENFVWHIKKLDDGSLEECDTIKTAKTFITERLSGDQHSIFQAERELAELEYDLKSVNQAASNESSLDSSCSQMIEFLHKQADSNVPNVSNDAKFYNGKSLLSEVRDTFLDAHLTSTEYSNIHDSLGWCQANRLIFRSKFDHVAKLMNDTKHTQELDDLKREKYHFVLQSDAITPSVANVAVPGPVASYFKNLANYFNLTQNYDPTNNKHSAKLTAEDMKRQIRQKKEKIKNLRKAFKSEVEANFQIIGNDTSRFSILNEPFEESKQTEEVANKKPTEENDFADVTAYHKYNDNLKSLAERILAENWRLKNNPVQGSDAVDVETKEAKRREEWASKEIKNLESLWKAAHTAIKQKIDSYKTYAKSMSDGTIATFKAAFGVDVTNDDDYITGLSDMSKKHAEAELLGYKTALKLQASKMSTIFSPQQIKTLPFYLRFVRAISDYEMYKETHTKIADIVNRYTDEYNSVEDERVTEKNAAKKKLDSFIKRANQTLGEDGIMQEVLYMEVSNIISDLYNLGDTEELKGKPLDGSEKDTDAALLSKYNFLYHPRFISISNAKIDIDFLNRLEVLVNSDVATLTDAYVEHDLKLKDQCELRVSQAVKAGVAPSREDQDEIVSIQKALDDSIAANNEVFDKYYIALYKYAEAKKEYFKIQKKIQDLSSNKDLPTVQLEDKIEDLKNQLGVTTSKLVDNAGNVITFKDKFEELDTKMASNKKLGTWCLVLLITTTLLNILGFAVVFVQLKKKNQATEVMEEEDEENLLTGDESAEEP